MSWFKPNIDRLRRRGDVPGLIKALDYPKDPSIRIRAVEALGEVGGSQAIQAIIEAASNGELSLRQSAVRALGSMNDPRAIKTLIQCLEEKSNRLRACAARSLGAFGGHLAVEPLLQCLSDPYDELRAATANALARIGSPAQEPLLRLLVLKNDDETTRKAIVRVLEKMAWQPSQGEAASIYWIEIGRPDKCVPLGADAVRPLLTALTSKKPQVRSAAAHALGGIRDGRAIEPLARLLADNTTSVRKAAVEALLQIGDVPALAELTRSFDDSAKHIRILVSEELAKRGESAVQPVLECFIAGGSSSRARSIALETLTRIGKPAVASLIGAIESTDPNVRYGAAEVLGGIADARAAEPLIRALKDGNSGVRKAAIRSLGMIGDKGAVDAVCRVLHDAVGSVRVEAVRALGLIGDVHVSNPLKEMLSDPVADVRLATVESLNRIGWIPDRSESAAAYWIERGQYRKCTEIGENAVTPLVRVLRCGDKRQRRAAIDALFKIGKPALPAIMGSLGNSQKDLQAHILAMLGHIEGQPVEPLIKALKDPSVRIRRAAAKALGVLKDNRAVVHLVEALRDDESSVRLVSAEALDAIGWKPQSGILGVVHLAAKRQWARCGEMGIVAVKPLVELLGDKSGAIRNGAQKALVALGEPAAPAIAKALSHEATTVRAAIADCLGLIGAQTAVNPLIVALSDEVALVRAAAVDALTLIGDRRAIDYIVVRLLDKDDVVKDMAAAALDSFGWIPTSEAQRAAYWTARGDYSRCVDVGAAAIKPLSIVLKHGNGDDRVNEIARVIDKIADKCPVESLLPLLSLRRTHQNLWRVRVAAARALLRIYKRGGLSPRDEQRIFAARTRMTATHSDSYVSSSDCFTGDTHEDSGIGIRFDLTRKSG